MILDCGHTAETAFPSAKGWVCFWCKVRGDKPRRKSRRTHGEVVLERVTRKKWAAYRREFNRKKP